MGKRILVVDDSAMMRKMIAKVLKENGHQVVGEGTNGEEAVSLYQSLRPDMVTMDITMRGMDGLSAGREIKKIDPGARILFLSNLDEDKYRDQANQIGVGLVNKHRSVDILALVNAD